MFEQIVLVRRELDLGDDVLRLGAAGDAAALFEQSLAHLGQKLGGYLSVHKQLLERVAGGGTRQLGVADDLDSHVLICGLVDVEVAIAAGAGDDGHRRVFEHEFFESVAAARNDDVDIFALAEQLGGAFARHVVDEADRVRRNALALQCLGDRAIDALVAADRLFAAAEHDRVAALETERRDVGGDVGASLVYDADHAQRDADFVDLQAVGARPLRGDLADRVGQIGNVVDALRHILDPLFGQREPVFHALAKRVGVGDILGVRRQDLVLCRADVCRDRVQSLALCLRAHHRDLEGLLLRPLADLFDRHISPPPAPP